MHGTDPNADAPGRGLITARTLCVILAGIVLIRLVTLPAYPLLDKSEARYAYIGELMVQTGNWITPFIEHGVPFWAKPILSFWMTAASLAAFGVNEFAARLPSFLIFLGVGFLAYGLGASQRDRELGLAAACIFASTSLTFYLGGTVMTDPALMLGVTVVMASYWKCVGSDAPGGRGWGYLFFIGVAIGALAKGPIGAIIPGLSIAAWATQHRKWGDTWRRLPWIGGTLLTLALVLPWYIAAEIRTPGFLRYFIVGEHFERFLVSHWEGDLYGAGRARPIGTIWLFGLISGLPWSAVLLVFVLRARARKELFQKAIISDPWLSYLIHWLLAPLVLFTFAKNILLTYVATSAPAFALLTAQAFRRIGERTDRYGFIATMCIVPVLFAGAVIAVDLDPGSNYFPSQKGIVATYKKLATNKASQLFYVFDKPYSADFYTGGTAKSADGAGDMDKALRAGYPFFVIAADVYPRLPDEMKKRVVIVTERNHDILLRPREPAPAPQ